jgi:hypothetical protein
MLAPGARAITVQLAGTTRTVTFAGKPVETSFPPDAARN